MPVLPGRPRDLAAAAGTGSPSPASGSTAPGIPVLADNAYQGAGGIAAVTHRRRPGKGLTVKRRCVNRAHSRMRWPVERTIARLKTWRLLRKARCSPNVLMSITKALLALGTHR
ncbi:transposase family protein [Streptomyces sp. x-80]|uniref:transposase family protein n=1 Tax=Streptomyces sp. x-80 TaxID=2789282 RepID=UPI00397F54A0